MQIVLREHCHVVTAFSDNDATKDVTDVTDSTYDLVQMTIECIWQRRDYQLMSRWTKFVQVQELTVNADTL